MRISYRFLIQRSHATLFSSSSYKSPPPQTRAIHTYQPQVSTFRPINNPTHNPFSSNWAHTRVFSTRFIHNAVNYSTFVETRVNNKNFERIYVQGGLNVQQSLVIEKIDKDENAAVDESTRGKAVIDEVSEGGLNSREESAVEKEAWRLLQESVVTYCGSPVGTVAANDPFDTQSLNYDQVFIRDFVPSTLAFLLKGDGEIVRNFLLHTLQLQVAALCRERMHVLMEQELMSASTGQGGEEQAAAEEGWRAAMSRCFATMDAVALSFCLCGIPGPGCRCHPVDVALVGSTAVVALLTPGFIFVANCGDSRAVLCRAGTAVPLSFDQKPDREDERARIIASGGQVLYSGGARVEGILAMSRAIGDKFLKSSVISEPEISITKREPEDECLILASDGLWDVLSSELACEIAHQCLQANAGGIEAEAGALFPSASASAAALLTRLAMGRKSSDNISVIVVDLK